MKRRRTVAAALALPLALLAVALLAVAGSGGGDGSAASAAGSASATVERRTLAERLTATGTIGYAGTATVVARLTGTLTWLPQPGDVVRRGERLYEIAGEPVALMYGEVPAYRELAEGVADGEDVRQLEGNLAALGYEPGAVDEEFTYLTAAAVREWQEDLGLEASGAVELGRVAFLPGPRRVTSVEAVLGESLGGGAGGVGGATLGETRGAGGTTVMASYGQPRLGAGARATEPAAGPEAEGDDGGGETAPPEAAGTAPQAGGGAASETSATEAAPEPAGEGTAPAPTQEQVPPMPAERAEAPAPAAEEAPAAPAAGEPAAGEEAADGEAPSVPVLQTSSTRRVVTVELEADQQSMARRGQRVEVVLPGGAEARGEVQRLAAVEAGSEAGAPGEGEAEAGLEVTVALVGRRQVPALDGASVSVVFTQRVREDVLAVPLTALLAIGGGRFAVLVEEAARTRQLVVTPGLAADGYVEVTGEGLREGMRVEVAE